MKRLWVILGALAVFCALSVGTASAQSFATGSWQVDNLQFRTNRAAYPAPGYVDSVSFSRASATGTTITVAFAETTTAISTSGWAIPAASGVLPDSVAVMCLFLSDAGSTSSAVDSVTVGMQVSVDGSNWVYVNQVANAAGRNFLTQDSPAVSAWPIPNAAGATTSTPKVFHKKWVKAAAAGAQYPDQSNFWLWPYIRFIILNDNSGGVTTNLKASVGHWSALGNR